MSGGGHYEFSANKIFFWLFAFTVAEVAWAEIGKPLEWGRLVLWGGLIGFAFFKGLYIAMYFMHLKFEGWIVKGLILPTPFLIAVILLAISPDVSRNDNLIHDLGAMYDPKAGVVHQTMTDTPSRPGLGHGADSDGSHGAGASEH